MFEALSFLTVLSAAPATLKFVSDALDFWSKVKALRLQKPARPLIEGDTFTKVEKRQLEAMYAAVDRSRPVAADIAARALRFYLFVAGLLVAGLIAASAALAWIPTTGWLIGGILGILIGGPLLIEALPSPVPDLVPVLNDARITKRAEEISRSLRAAWHEVSTTAQVSVRAAGVSIPERVFLDLYFRAAALIRVLECGLLVADLEKSISTVHETLTGRVFETGLGIIERLAREGQLDNVEDRRTVLSREFSGAGLGDLVEPALVGDDFFRSDFRFLAMNRHNLRKHLENYWSSKSRRW